MAEKKNITPYLILGLGIAAALGVAAYVVFRKKPIPCSSRFLFIGDSNTTISHAYSKQLKSFCPGAQVKEIAQSGRNTNTMLQTLAAELQAGNKYDVIAILGGSNDLCCPDAYPTKSNLAAMYQMAKASGAKVVAITPPSKKYVRLGDPTWGGSNYQGMLDRLQGIVTWIKQNGTPDLIIDWNKITDNEAAFVGTDYMHANSNAHKILLNEMINRLPIKSA